MRLLKLVNNLLDFSRIEAGRSNPQYEWIDLSKQTTDLVSCFRYFLFFQKGFLMRFSFKRSTCEQLSIQLSVDCTLKEKVWVDPDMWEKIVLNLVSNACKYTWEGGKITVTLEKQGKSFLSSL